jgi:LytS/YehU family sensor histidine kinase
MVQVDDSALSLHFPPMALLTLVENSVRHGIDPSEAGGRIEVRVVEENGRCRCQVIDTGVGLQDSFDNIGTGLSNLRERLHLMFGDESQLRLTPLVPRGTSAELEFPARRGLP